MSVNRFAAWISVVLAAAVGGVVHARGTVDFVEGTASLTTAGGETRLLKAGERVEVGDTVVTGSDGEVHVRTDDSGLLALRRNTRLKIDAYQADGGDADHAVLRLLKGSFRSVTGWIGKTNARSYAVKTATATIGIRGTDHEPLVIDEGPEAGTYDKVNEGGTLLDTPFGKIDIAPGQAGFAPRGTIPPTVLPKVPAFFVPTRNEAAIEKKKADAETAAPQRLEDRRKESGARPKKEDKGRGGDTDGGRDARLALDEHLRAYERGDLDHFRRKLSPSMIGYQKMLDDILADSTRCKHMRFNLSNVQAQGGKDLAVVQATWEKRCLLLPNYTPQLETGQGTFLMHKSAGGWGLAGITGGNPFKPVAAVTSATSPTLATVSASLPYTCFNIANGIAPLASLQMPVTVTDPDKAGATSVSVKITNAAGDVETFSIPAVSSGVFKRVFKNTPTSEFHLTGTPAAGNGRIDINIGVGPTCSPITVTYTDTTVPGGGSQNATATINIP